MHMRKVAKRQTDKQRQKHNLLGVGGGNKVLVSNSKRPTVPETDKNFQRADRQVIRVTLARNIS